MLGQLAGAVGPILRLPLTAADKLEHLLEQLSTVATRALLLLDTVETIPSRIDAVLADAEVLSARLEGVLATADALTEQIAVVLKRTDALTRKVDRIAADAAGTLASVQPAIAAIGALPAQTLASLVEDLGALLAGARGLDPGLVGEATGAVRAVPALMATVEADLRPALAQLEGLVPVVAQLGVQVDHLDGTVAEVGALLGGIPGAARLLKRGERPKPT